MSFSNLAAVFGTDEMVCLAASALALAAAFATDSSSRFGVDYLEYFLACSGVCSSSSSFSSGVSLVGISISLIFVAFSFSIYFLISAKSLATGLFLSNLTIRA